ncbi:MAG: ribonuclease G [Chromatiaceae bacterium]|nr:ribonuclease G [Chromatiaceae bacterium]
MSEEILINVSPPETRVAVIENGVAQEIIIERNARRGLVGNIYKGQICRVLPGMQAAFVEIGLDRAAFLHASDISYKTKTVNGQTVNITDLVREGGEIVVQVVKDPLGTKGARLTTNLSIPSRYLVFMPSLRSAGVSQKIDNQEERTRLRRILDAFIEESGCQGGFIARTAAEGVSESTLQSDMQFLFRLWRDIEERLLRIPPRNLIYEDPPLLLRALRDLVTPLVEKIRIDSLPSCEKIQQFAAKVIPHQEIEIEYYAGARPLFDLYNVEDEIEKALQRKVELKSGGHLVIDQTEAMTTIDVNTGAFVGHRNLEETIYKTNMEAAQAIGRQLRLRNLGGIIIIDFIDMNDDEHKRQVIRALEKCLSRDHAKTQITEVSALGLVEMTRKRTRESLEHVLCETCHCCNGRGSQKTTETTCYEIFREILREARQFDVESLLVLASQPVIDRLLDEESANLAELEASLGKVIRLQAEQLYTQEQYDIVLI